MSVLTRFLPHNHICKELFGSICWSSPRRDSKRPATYSLPNQTEKEASGVQILTPNCGSSADPREPTQVLRALSSKSALPVPCPAQGTSYLNGVCRRPCTLSRAASLPEKEKQIQTQPDPVVCGEPGQILPLSKSFLKSRIWRVPEALPQASAEFSVFPSQCGDPCFINAKNQTSTQPAWNGGETSSVLWDF